MQHSQESATISVAARRRHNRDLALKLGESGLYVFPSLDKTPCVKRWPERAEDIAEDRGEAEFMGSTRDAKIIREMWRAFPDAVPSVSAGPSGLLVLDADSKKGGPAHLLDWAEREGVDLSQFPTTRTQSDGLHVYMSNSAALGSAAGAFGDLGVDVRGAGGQVVAPGAIRADGKRYVQERGRPELLAALRAGAIPQTPEAVRLAIARGCTRISGHDGASSNVERLDVAREMRALQELDWPDFAELTDALDGKYDLDALARKDSEFAELRDRGDANGDRSDARYNLAKCLSREWPDMTAVEYAAVLAGLNDEDSDMFGTFVEDATPSQGGGEFNYRNIARDYLRGKAQGAKQGKKSDGSAFGAVDDEGNAADKKPKTKKRKLRFELFSDVAQAALDDADTPLIAGMLDQGAMSVIYGESNAGKSFVALDMGFHVATGRRWNDRATSKGLVVYVAAEGGRRFARRVAALHKHFGAEASGAAFALVRSSVDLRARGGDAQAIIDLVREAETETGNTAALIVVDTLSRAMAGGDENSSIDMGALVKNCDDIREATKAHLMLVHHAGKDRAKGARGHSLLRAATDSELEIVNSRIVTRKQRDLEFAQDIAFSLKHVDLGVDAAGAPQGSAVVALGVAAPKVERAATALALKGNQLELFTVITAMAAARAAAGGRPAHDIALPFVEVRERVEAQRRADGAKELGDAIRSVKRVLLSKGLIVEPADGVIRLPGAAEAFSAVDEAVED